MTHGNFANHGGTAGQFRQVKKPHNVGDMAAGFAHRLRDFGLLAPIDLRETLIGFRLLDGIQIDPLDVLDKGDFRRFFIRQLTD